MELDVDDDGEDTVRVSDGVLVRESGRRNETFLILSKGEGYRASASGPH